MLAFGFLKKVLKYLNLLLLFLIVSLIPFAIGKYFQWETDKREREAISDKVRGIMKLYHCEDQEIYKAIMNTFDPVLVAVVIAVESEFKVNAISRAGCRGLMQLSPDKLDDWQNIHKNIQIGSAYLEAQLKRFGDLELAFAAYNAGPEAVAKYRGVPPYRETINYIKKAKRLVIAFNETLSGKAPEPPAEKRIGALF